MSIATLMPPHTRGSVIRREIRTERGLIKTYDNRGTWVAQSVKRPTSAQVMILRFVSSSPASGSVLTAQSLEPTSDSVSPPLSAPPPLTLCLSSSLSLSKINIKKKKDTQSNLVTCSAVPSRRGKNHVLFLLSSSHRYKGLTSLESVRNFFVCRPGSSDPKVMASANKENHHQG